MCGVAMHLPVQIHTSLVLRQWIELPWFVRLQFFIGLLFTAVCQSHDSTYRGLFHYVCYLHLQVQFLKDGRNQFHGRQRVQAHRYQVGSDTKLVMTQDATCDVEYLLFLFILRHHHILCLHHRVRQLSAVYLAIRQIGEIIQRHVDFGAHIFCQLRILKEAAQLILAHLTTFLHGVVEHQMLHAHHLANGSHSLLNGFMVLSLSLYLAQFYSETTQLHLIVYTS